MVNLKTGDYVNLSDAKSGMGAKGPWLLIPVKAQKGKDQITVFADNPDECKNWEAGKIKEIKSCSYGHKQVNGTWYAQVTVNAVIEKADAMEAGFIADPLADNNLPFN